MIAAVRAIFLCKESVSKSCENRVHKIEALRLVAKSQNGQAIIDHHRNSPRQLVVAQNLALHMAVMSRHARINDMHLRRQLRVSLFCEKPRRHTLYLSALTDPLSPVARSLPNKIDAFPRAASQHPQYDRTQRSPIAIRFVGLAWRRQRCQLTYAEHVPPKQRSRGGYHPSFALVFLRNYLFSSSQEPFHTPL
jgi:hypothetical protein